LPFATAWGELFSPRFFFCPKTKGTTADPCNEQCIAVQQQYRSSNIITTATAVQLAHGAAWETGERCRPGFRSRGRPSAEEGRGGPGPLKCNLRTHGGDKQRF